MITRQAIAAARVVLVTEKELNIELLPYPPYCPDLVVSDFWLKNRLHGQKYEPREELRCAVNKHLREMSLDSLQAARGPVMVCTVE